jgi:hypothetical protein
MPEIEIEYDEGDAERALLTGRQWRRFLDGLGYTIVGHAIPHSGVDTGMLVQSMGHRVEPGEGGHLELVLGSGAATGVREIWYAAAHWADKPPTLPPDGAVKRKRRDHPTRPAPTRPWSKALRALGITYNVEPGGYES